jgi:GNAT superfamily N-acetyltransferase
MLEILEPTPEEVARAISQGIARSNDASDIQRENFAIVERHDERLIGGITASVSFSVLFINNMWVEDDRRGLGIGRALMLAAETEGHRRGARTACVDTLSTQAPGFYAKLGYQEFGRVHGEAGGQAIDRIWFHKAL